MAQSRGSMPEARLWRSSRRPAGAGLTIVGQRVAHPGLVHDVQQVRLRCGRVVDCGGHRAGCWLAAGWGLAGAGRGIRAGAGSPWRREEEGWSSCARAGRDGRSRGCTLGALDSSAPLRSAWRSAGPACIKCTAADAVQGARSKPAPPAANEALCGGPKRGQRASRKDVALCHRRCRTRCQLALRHRQRASAASLDARPTAKLLEIRSLIDQARAVRPASPRFHVTPTPSTPRGRKAKRGTPWSRQQWAPPWR